MIGNFFKYTAMFFREFRLAILVCIVCTFIFFAWKFPFGDLADLVTTMVSTATQNAVYIQFENLDIGLIPSPSVSGTGVQLEAANLPPIQAQYISISPSWLDIIANVGTVISAARNNLEAQQKLLTAIGVSISAEKLMGADVDLKIKSGGKNDQGATRSKIYLEVESLDLSEVPRIMELPFQLTGNANLTSSMVAYPNFEEQPEGDVELMAKSVKLPPSTVPTMMGPLNLPAISMNDVLFKGRLTAGFLQIDEATLGSGKDAVKGRIKGKMGMRLDKTGRGIVPNLGEYDLKVDLQITPAGEKDFGLLLGLLSSYKSAAPGGGSRYLLQVKAAKMGYPPEMTQLSSF